jgi:carbon storage regulator
MLVLTRRQGEGIIIDGGIRVTVVSVHGEKVRLGVMAPSSVVVDREETHERRLLFESKEARLRAERAMASGARPLQGSVTP